MADEYERRAALRAWLADQETEYGPVPDDVLQAVLDDWLDIPRVVPVAERIALPDVVLLG